MLKRKGGVKAPDRYLCRVVYPFFCRPQLLMCAKISQRAEEILCLILNKHQSGLDLGSFNIQI